MLGLRFFWRFIILQLAVSRNSELSCACSASFGYFVDGSYCLMHGWRFSACPGDCVSCDWGVTSSSRIQLLVFTLHSLQFFLMNGRKVFWVFLMFKKWIPPQTFGTSLIFCAFIAYGLGSLLKCFHEVAMVPCFNFSLLYVFMWICLNLSLYLCFYFSLLCFCLFMNLWFHSCIGCMVVLVVLVVLVVWLYGCIGCMVVCLYGCMFVWLYDRTIAWL